MTWSAAAGWVTTAAGTIDAASNLPLTNKVGGSLLPTFVPGVKAMPAGYNVVGIRYYQPVPYYSNVMKHAGNWQSVAGSPTFTVGSDGYLTALAGGSVGAIVSLTDVGPDGYPGLPEGVYTLQWDGNGILILDGRGTPTVTQLSSNLTGTINNTRTYNVTRAGTYNLSLRATMSSFGTTGCTNIRIWPPGTTMGSKWHAQFLRMLTGVKSLRFMDALTPNGPIGNFSDFMPQSQCTYGTDRPYTNLAISTVGPGANSTELGRTSVRVTTTTPHGLNSGQVVYFPILNLTFNTTTTTGTLDNWHLAVQVVSEL